MKFEMNDFVNNVELIKNFNVENVKNFEVVEFDEYEENIEFVIKGEFVNGDEFEIEGYNGLWEMLSYDKLSEENKVIFWNEMSEWLEFVVECNL